MPNALVKPESFVFQCGWDHHDGGEFNAMATGQIEMGVTINGYSCSVILSHADIRALHEWLGGKLLAMPKAKDAD